MKKLKVFLLLTCILIFGCVYNASAQFRPEKTSGARAAYGKSGPSYKGKARKKSKKKNSKRAARRSRREEWIPSKKNWAS
jgi:hypothetical protein